jgi:inorganic pyrophosphatase
MLDYISKTVHVIVDRPLGSRHPEYKTLYYPLNYGYVPGTLAADGEEIDAYIIGVFEPVAEFTGTVTAVIHRKNDNEDKLVVAKDAKRYSREQITALVEFQERFFDSEVITADNKSNIY